MKKKVFSLALVVCCLSVFIASSTLAYFTKEDTATNVITTGKIDIDLVEEMVDPESGDLIVVEKDVEEGQEKLKFNVTGVMPGQEVVKVVYVENEQYADEAWVRIKLTKSIVLADGTEGDPSLLEIDFNTNWIAKADEKGNTWYYCKDKLAKDGETVPLMESVVFSTKAGNEYQNATATITILAQAVQVKNNPIPDGGSVTDIIGWPS